MIRAALGWAGTEWERSLGKCFGFSPSMCMLLQCLRLRYCSISRRDPFLRALLLPGGKVTAWAASPRC